MDWETLQYVKALARKYLRKSQATSVLERIVQMYDNARSPSVTLDQVKRAFEELSQLKVSKSELEDYAAQVDVRSGGSIPQIIQKMRSSVMNRKGDAERNYQ